MTTTLCTEQDVLDLIGIYADGTISASNTIIDRYINRAEGVVCAATQIDYIGNYSNVDTTVKQALKSCVASHAAFKIIAYNMEGWATRSEAITMMNSNFDEFTTRLKELKDLDTNKLRSVET